MLVVRVSAALLAALALGLIGGPAAAQVEGAADARSALLPFGSEAELEEYLKRRARKAAEVEAANDSDQSVVSEIVVTGTSASPSITNTQEAGVDEGGIVKLSGDTLVVLRRGRLFSVSTAGGKLRAIDSIPAYPPGVDASRDWYDEMLVAGDRVVVIGYSYGRGGTEINRFRLSPDGRLRFEDAYQLKSNDYYSSRNYASRLIDDRLVFYTPLHLNPQADLLESLPQLRRWREQESDEGFKPIASARDVYLPPPLRTNDKAVEALHTVVSCNLTAAELGCSATGIFGPSSRTFYVSKTAVYVWVSDWRWDEKTKTESTDAFVYRLPLQGGRPSALGVHGSPVDQFSFREDADARRLDVLVRSEGGDEMWRPEFSDGAVALVSLPIALFGDGSRQAGTSRYRFLPTPEEDSWSFRNRFVGDHVLYGSSSDDHAAVLYAARVTDGQLSRFRLPHGLNRIEVLGTDALAVGSQGRELVFSTVRLPEGGRPRLGERLVLPNAAEADSRSHAYFYRPDAGSPTGASGLLGLPINRAAPDADEEELALAFLKRSRRSLSPLGELDARAEAAEDDCQASCVDWYGNARPIFLGHRIIGLMGYELVEGALRNGRIREIGRLAFTPKTERAALGGPTPPP